MKMPVPVGVTRAAAPSLRIAHDAQDARRIRLQHINNNHSNVTAKDPQTPCPRRCRARANTSQPRPNRSGDLAHQHGRVATGSAEHREVAAARGRVHTDNMRVVDQVIGVDNTEPLAVALEDRASRFPPPHTSGQRAHRRPGPGVPCRQVGVELVKQAYRAPEGVQRGCWDLMDDLAAGFWAVYPEETAQRCCGSNWTLRADNVAGMVTPSSIRQLLVGEYLMPAE